MANYVHAASKFLDKFDDLLSPTSNTSPELKESIYESSAHSKGTSHFPNGSGKIQAPIQNKSISGKQGDDPFTYRAANSATRQNIFSADKTKDQILKIDHFNPDKENASGISNESQNITNQSHSSITSSMKKASERQTLKPTSRFPLREEQPIQYAKTVLSNENSKKIQNSELHRYGSDMPIIPLKIQQLDFSDTYKTLNSEISTTKKQNLHLLADTQQSLGSSLRNLGPNITPNANLQQQNNKLNKALENEKLKLEKEVLELKIQLKTKEKENETMSEKYTNQISALIKKYENEIEGLQNRLKQQNERFYARLEEKEKECFEKFKIEEEHRINQEKSKLIDVISLKDKDIEKLQNDVKNLESQLTKQKAEYEEKIRELKNDYENKVHLQAKAQIKFESETLQRLEKDKVEETRLMQERFNLDLEYEKYKLRKKANELNSIHSKKSIKYGESKSDSTMKSMGSMQTDIY